MPEAPAAQPEHAEPVRTATHLLSVDLSPTPGPWRIYDDGADAGTHVMARGAANQETQIVCERIDGAANARLISAAPDMLAALRAVAALPSDPARRDMTLSDAINHMVGIAEAAIASVEGR